MLWSMAPIEGYKGPLLCKHCGTMNTVAICHCGKPYVITSGHLKGQIRSFEDAAVTNVPADLRLKECDFCASKTEGRPLPERVASGLRQRSCPSCRTQFLSDHNI